MPRRPGLQSRPVRHKMLSHGEAGGLAGAVTWQRLERNNGTAPLLPANGPLSELAQLARAPAPGPQPPRVPRFGFCRQPPGLLRRAGAGEEMTGLDRVEKAKLTLGSWVSNLGVLLFLRNKRSGKKSFTLYSMK